MKFCDLVEELALGDLSQSPLVKCNTFEIQPKYLPTLIQHMNRALEHFYTVYPLRYHDLLVQLHPNQTRYKLTEEHLVLPTEYPSIDKYILDTKWYGDVIQISEIVSLDNREFSVADPYSCEGITFSEPDCIEVFQKIDFEKSSVLRLRCRIAHPRIPLSTSLSSPMEIELPRQLIGAFMAYVACLYLQSMGGAKLVESNTMYAKYKSLMEDIITSGGAGISLEFGSNIFPKLNGWI